MGKEDYEGIFKYKLILPTLIIINVIMMFVGTFYLPKSYKFLGILTFSYFLYRTLAAILIMIRGIIQANNIFKKVESGYYKKIQQSQQRSQIYYGFIIPNYKEEMEVLVDTLKVLAKQKRAKNRYLVFLAMEQNEQSSDIKARELQQRFKNQFKAIEFTIHVLQPGQQAGKAANASWCAEHLQPILQKYNIEQQKLFLTIMDADTWAPESYFQELQQNLIDQPQQRHNSIYMPPQIYTRNNLQVPLFTRVGDQLHSFIHASILYSTVNITFPLSNYTMSYSLLKKIGFWDTCADAIAQDMHMVQKSFWKTDGNIITKPIFVCFNQLNVQTGDGYFANLFARFWQVERHGQGCVELAYCVKKFVEEKFKFINLIFFIIIIQCLVMQVIVPFQLYSYLLFQPFLPAHDQNEAYLSVIMSYLLNLTGILNFLLGLTNEILKRRTNTKIYKQQNEGLWRIVEYQIFSAFIMFVFAIPALTLAAFKVLRDNRQYSKSEKKISSRLQIQDEQTDYLNNEKL